MPQIALAEASPTLLDYGLSEELSPISLPSPQGGGWQTDGLVCEEI